MEWVEGGLQSETFAGDQQNTQNNMAATHRGAVPEQSRPMAAMRQGVAKGRKEKDDDLRLTFRAIYPNLRASFQGGSNQRPLI